MYHYPETRRDSTVEQYHGIGIADPYRWLEDDNAAETRDWVERQNRFTQTYLAGDPGREAWRRRLGELWNFEKFGLPRRYGERYFASYNSGLLNQPQIRVSADSAGPGRVVLDPNTMSADGTVSLPSVCPSPDGSLLAYARAEAGSDWVVWRILETESGRELPDTIHWCKNGELAWLGDASGFFYSRFAEPQEGAELTALNQGQSVWFHRLGTDQSADRLVYERLDHCDWYLSPVSSDDYNWLIIYASPGCNPETGIFIKDLRVPDAPVLPLFAAFDAAYYLVDTSGDEWLVVTDLAAPRQRLVAVRPGSAAHSGGAALRELIPQDSEGRVLEAVRPCGDSLLAVYMRDARSELYSFRRDGSGRSALALPGIGTVLESGSSRAHAEAFVLFVSLARPAALYRWREGEPALDCVAAPRLKFNAEDFVTEQAFYPSKDGTRIPLFIARRRDVQPGPGTPTLLYGYGGFNIPVRPRFEPTEMAWLDRGGVVVLACLRGGGEYGLDWYNGGRLANKQNVFDDFIAAAEWLVAEGRTSRKRLAINGRSNGGLLVGACLTQRPDLFGAAVPEVGVMDMLRYHKFTLGWGWTSDYGCSDTQEGFDIVIKYSPLHNISRAVRYPPTMVMTCDHDDRVIPAHSHKFTATLQAAQQSSGGTAPILTRITVAAGHGAGMPTEKRIEERADLLSFLTLALDIDWGRA